MEINNLLISKVISVVTVFCATTLSLTQSIWKQECPEGTGSRKLAPWVGGGTCRDRSLINWFGLYDNVIQGI